MKHLKKGLKIGGIIFGVLLLFLISAPFIFKGKIVQAVKNTANKTLNAKLDFNNDISLSFFKNFPNVSLDISKLSIVGIDSFAGDTLVSIPQLHLTLDVMSVFKGEEIGVKRVGLTNPFINIETLHSGLANWDIVKADTSVVSDTTTGSSFKMALNELKIENGHLIYNDRSLNFYTELHNLNHTSKGDFTADNFVMSTHTETPSLILGYGGINWLYKVKSVIDAEIQMDMPSYKFSFEKGKAKLNDLDIESNGFVDLNDNDIEMDIAFKALQNEFKSFLSLVPGMYTESFKDIKSSGQLSFSGQMKGKMTDDKMPSINVALNIREGAFQYPGMSYGADRIFLDLKYNNPDGNPDNSVVNVDRFLARIAGETINLNMLLKTPVSDPYIDGALKGNVDLSRISGLVPMEKGTKLSGIINADISAIGNYSAAKSQNFSKLNAKGILKIKNLLYQGVTDKDAYKIDDLLLNFTPTRIEVNSCTGNIGKSDFDISGYIQNIFGYAFANETLTGDVNFKSSYMNINSLMGESTSDQEPKPSDTASITSVELPANLDMKLNAKVGKLIYDNYVLTDVGGTAHLHNSQLDMQNLKAGMLGGRIELNGTYDSKNIKNPFTSLTTKIEKFNLVNTVAYFPMLQKFAPIAKHIDGMFNANIDMNSILDEYMQPNYESMNVNGVLNFTDAAVNNLDILKQIGSKLNVNWLQNLQMKNQQIKFQIKEGIFTLLDSLTMPLGQGAVMKLSGQSKLDQTINYGGWIKVPRAALGAGNKALDGWIKQASGKGWDLKVEEQIPIDLSVTGTFLKPNVSVSLKGFAQSTVQNLKDKGKAIVNDEKDKKISEAIEAARKRGETIVNEAHKRSEQVRREGRESADKIRRESESAADAIRKQGDAAYDRIMAETETAAKAAENKVAVPALKKAAGDRVREEGRKKAEKTKEEFYNKAGQTQDAGFKRAQQVEEEANRKADEIDHKAQQEVEKMIRDAEQSKF